MAPAEPELAAGAEPEPSEPELEPVLLPEFDAAEPDDPESSEPAEPLPDCEDEPVDPVLDRDEVPAALLAAA